MFRYGRGDLVDVFIGAGMRVVYHENDRYLRYVHHGAALDAFKLLEKIIREKADDLNFVAKFHHVSEGLRAKEDDFHDMRGVGAIGLIHLDSFYKSVAIVYFRPPYYEHRYLGPYTVRRSTRARNAISADAVVIESWRDLYLDSMKINIIAQYALRWPEWVKNPPPINEMKEVAKLFGDNFSNWPSDDEDTIGNRKWAVIATLARIGREMGKNLPHITTEEAVAKDKSTLRLDCITKSSAFNLHRGGWKWGEIYKMVIEAEALTKLYKPNAYCVDSLIFTEIVAKYVINKIERESCGAQLTERARAALGERNPQRARVYSLFADSIPITTLHKVGRMARGMNEISLEVLRNLLANARK